MPRRIPVVLVAVGLLATPAFAQYENFTLSPGFSPDPATGSGQSGGPVDAATHGSTAHGPCVGMIDDSPDHTLVLTAAFTHLRVHATSQADTSLVIQGPDGFRCNDDADGVNPVIEGAWPAGTYEIYVGSVTPGNHDYTLTISAGRPAGEGGADFENVTLSPGFVPDPRVLTGLSGGPVNATTHGETSQGPCVGAIDDTPDHVMELTAAFAHLKLHAISDQDTSLVVKGPDGLRCNDDTDGLNPVLEGEWPAGRYEIYVGSVDPGMHRYRLIITELR